MQIEVLYFAAARERAGTGAEAVTLPEGATLADLIDALTAKHAPLEPLWPHVRLAVDEAFVSDHAAPLKDGATVALIPPVSGG